MNEKSIAEIVASIDPDPQEQLAWTISLGAELTIAARNFYEVGTDRAERSPLRGFNEIQHRIYGRIGVLRDGNAWTTDSFLQMMRDTSRHYNVEADVRSAIRRSVSYRSFPTSQ
jgi:hypothetical protein